MRLLMPLKSGLSLHMHIKEALIAYYRSVTLLHSERHHVKDMTEIFTAFLSWALYSYF